MRLKPSSYFLLFLIGVGIVFVVYSLTFSPPQAKLVGLMVAPLVIILGVIQLLREIKETADEPETEGQSQMYVGSGTPKSRTGLLALWVGGFVAITYLLGFLVSTPLFLLSYLKLNGTKWMASIITAAITTAILYGLFEVFLLRKLWRGIIFFQ